MTCKHVLDVIDAGPFVDVAPATLEAARVHARGCATCGPALDAADTLTRDLDVLAKPGPPPQLATTVLARIARIEAGARDAAAADGRSSALSAWSAWGTAIGGFGAGLAMVLATLLRDVTTIGSAPPTMPAVAAGVSAMFPLSPAIFLLAAILLVSVIGLFATVGVGESLTNS